VIARLLRRFWIGFERVMAPRVPATRLGVFRAIVCLVALYDVMLWSTAVLSAAAEVGDGTTSQPWTPIFLFQVLGVQPIGTETAEVLYLVAVISLLCGVVGLGSRLSCLVAAVCFYWWSGLAYSWGKPHHDKVALAITLAALPFARVGAGFSIDAFLKRRRRRAPGCERTVRAMPIRLAQITLAFGYGGAGLSKLILGGPEWFNGYTLQGIMLGHDGYLSRWVGQSPTLCQLQSVGVVFVQAAFPLVLFWSRLRWFFLPMATFFHLMTWMTMDTGPYMRVWLMLFAFVDLEKVPAALVAGLRRGPWSACLTVLGVTALAALVGFVASQAIAVPALCAFGGLLLLWFALWAALRGWNAGPIAVTTSAQ